MAGHTYAQSPGADKHTNKHMTARQKTLFFFYFFFYYKLYVCLSFSVTPFFTPIISLGVGFLLYFSVQALLSFFAIFHFANVLTYYFSYIKSVFDFKMFFKCRQYLIMIMFIH